MEFSKGFARLWCLCTACVVFAPAWSGRAQNTWIAPGSGLWHVPENWSLLDPPTTTPALTVVGNAATKTVTLNAATPSLHLLLNQLNISAPAGQTNTVFLNNVGTNRPLVVQHTLTLGSGGRVVVSNSTLRTQGSLGGLCDLTRGSLVLESGHLTVVNTMVRVGREGPALLEVNGGAANIATNLQLGYLTNGHGLLHVNGGTVLITRRLSAGDDRMSLGQAVLAGGQLIATNVDTASRIGDDGGGELTVLTNALARFGGLEVGVTSASNNVVRVLGGTLDLTGRLLVADDDGSVGHVLVDGGLLTATNSTVGTTAIETRIGDDGLGLFTLSNGTVRLADVVLGKSTGAQGTLAMHGGLLEMRRLRLADDRGSFGTISISGGELVATNLAIGTNSIDSRVGDDGVGVMDISTAVVRLGQLDVGEATNSSGTLWLRSGLLHLGRTLYVGNDLGSTGSVIILGGQLTATNLMLGTNEIESRIGDDGTGTLILSNGLAELGHVVIGRSARSHGRLHLHGGALHISDRLNVGDGRLATGSVLVAAGQLFATNSGARIGDDGRGEMTVSGGTAWMDDMTVGRSTNGNGYLGLTGGLLQCRDLSIGRESSTGSVVMTAGQLLLPNDTLRVGREGVGQFTLFGGQVNARQIVVAPASPAQGTFIQHGGITAVSSNVLVGGPGWAGQVILVGGDLILTNAAGQGTLALRGGELGLQGASLIVDRLEVTNAGASMVFSHGLLRTKGTRVNNGLPFVVGDGSRAATFYVDGGAHFFPNGLIISPGATLAGCANIIGPVTMLGTDARTDCPLPPVFVAPLASLSVTQGATVIFNGLAVGSAPLSYQWWIEPGHSTIPGAIGPVLTLGNVQTSQAGQYWVVVNNAFGSITSEVAVLRVVLAPQVSQVSREGTTVGVLFASELGVSYILEYKNALDAPAWTVVATQPGNGGMMTMIDPAAVVPIRFYRVRVE